MALIALERFEEALDCCTRCLEFDSNNKSVQQLRDRAQSGKTIQDRKEKEKVERRNKEAEAKRVLNIAYKARNIIPIHDPNSEMSPYAPHFVNNTETSRSNLVIPVFFLYPQHATSDLISQYNETVPFSDHLFDMFPSSNSENKERRPDWDKNGEYLAPNLVVYAITQKKRLLKVGKKMTLMDLCGAAKGKDGQVDGLELKNSCLSVVVLPKGEVERRWVEEFKTAR
ncbi:hypothetical protein K439DRAFT_995991 [Ramaria rubella]|nr:hypothetical protein K439DRAFT_995991 [Ramaria rubella]